MFFSYFIQAGRNPATASEKFDLYRVQAAISGVSRVKRSISAKLGAKVVTISDNHLRKLIAIVDDDDDGALDVQEMCKMFEYLGIPDAEVCG